jgi:hypothetical protein
MSRQIELEAKLTLQQRKAALLLVENELIGAANDEKKSQEEMAEEVGVGRMTLYRWRTQNKVFIEYMNLIADDFLGSHRAEVYSQLLKTIRGSQPSIKGIDLFLRRFGLLTDRQVTTTEGENDKRSNEDLAKELEDLDDLLED